MADDRARMLSLAKVLIAAAWADGEITLDEQNSLRDIIFHLSDSAVTLSAQEWALLEMYIESPIGADERTTLVAELQDAIRNKAERDFVLNALQQMAFADGVSGGEEQQVIQEITDAIEQADTGLLDGLNRLLGRTLSRRSAAVAGAPDRAVYFEDYLNN
ncbi:MAG: TerB family tellurite resistance protein, partial [Candidatus Promineifilaceae bacterium]